MSTPRKSTVRGTAGSSTRQPEIKRLITGLCLLLALQLVIILFTGNSKRVVSFGRPVAVVIFGIDVVVLKTLEKKVGHVTKRANDAARGAVADVVNGQLKTDLHAHRDSNAMHAGINAERSIACRR
jgi:hypothetical protein